MVCLGLWPRQTYGHLASRMLRWCLLHGACAMPMSLCSGHGMTHPWTPYRPSGGFAWALTGPLGTTHVLWAQKVEHAHLSSQVFRRPCWLVRSSGMMRRAGPLGSTSTGWCRVGFQSYILRGWAGSHTRPACHGYGSVWTRCAPGGSLLVWPTHMRRASLGNSEGATRFSVFNLIVMCR